MGYKVPSGCTVLSNKTDTNKFKRTCPDEHKFNLTHCEVSENGIDACDRWTIFEWLFTPKPGVFGLVGGFANVTGFGLIAILTIMCICSMPFVRRGEHFQVY